MDSGMDGSDFIRVIPQQ